jgi:hypothetical protein
MRARTILHGVALAATLGLMAGGQTARADDCDDEQDELKKLVERVINNSPDPKGVGPVCAFSGQLLGITKAGREIAAECYDDGQKRDQILAGMDKGIREMEEKIAGICK